MSVLSGEEISRRVELGQLSVVPWMPEALSSDSLDLHLCGEYITFERVWSLEVVDLWEQKENGFLSGELAGCVNKVINTPNLVMRGGEVVVAYLQERLNLPSDLCGYIDGKSKWARLGLQVASAGLVHAGWQGVPVLELVNLGKIPLRLRPGLPICQIWFMEVLSLVEKGD